MKLPGLHVLVAFAAPLLVLGACTKTGPTRADGGHDFSTVADTDGGSADDLSSDSDGGPLAQGTLLAPGNIDIVGVLPDDTIIYLATDAKISLNAIPAGGGTPTVIAADLNITGVDTDDSYQVAGGVVGLWTGVDADGNAKLQIWTKAKGLKDAAALVPAADYIAGSIDGTRVGFIRKNGTADELVISLTDFPAAATPVVVQAALGRGTAATECQPDYAFAGNYLFSATCTGTGTTATIRRSTDTGVPLSVITGRAPIVNMNDAGDRVFSWTRPGTARVYSIDAGGAVTSVAVDTTVTEGQISADGATVAYVTSAGALKSAPTATGTPVTLIAAGGAKSIDGITGDFKAIFTNKLDPSTNQDIDLQWSTIGVAAAPTTLVATATGALAGFTATNSHVFYVPDSTTGVLKVRPLTAGGAEVDLGASVFGGEVLGGTKVVLGANIATVKAGGNDVNVIDLQLLDVAGSAPAVPLVSAVQALTGQQDYNFRVVGNKLVFVQVADGLYVKDLP